MLNVNYKDEKDKTRFHKTLVVMGVIVLVMSGIFIVFVPLETQSIIGIVLLFIVGFGCCIAGTDTEEGN